MLMIDTVVTSCSLEGWRKYGERFVETFYKFWPTHVTLHLVSEDDLPISNDVLLFQRLGQSEAWRWYDENSKNFKWTRGDSGTPRPSGVAPRWITRSGYNFRFDAYKFSKKVFAIELVAGLVKTGRLMWLDADTLTHAPVPSELPAHLLPSSYALSCLSRVGYHSECGFVGYNLDHTQTSRFIKEFSKLYTSGAVYNLAEWHDSWVFDWLRNKTLTPTYNIPHKSKGHPFINSELGKYLDHLKGSRKDRGRSAQVECVSNSKEPYWQGGRFT